MSDTFKRFTELDVWKQARVFKLEVYELIRLFPNEEKFKLTDQILRSSRSIPANISEGHGRFTYKDQMSFCIVARGSLCETLNHLIDAYDCKYIDLESFKKIGNGAKNGWWILEKLCLLFQRQPKEEVGSAGEQPTSNMADANTVQVVLSGTTFFVPVSFIA